MVETSYFLVTPVKVEALGSISAIKSRRDRPGLPIALTHGVQLPGCDRRCPDSLPACPRSARETGSRCSGDIFP